MPSLPTDILVLIGRPGNSLSWLLHIGTFCMHKFAQLASSPAALAVLTCTYSILCTDPPVDTYRAGSGSGSGMGR